MKTLWRNSALALASVISLGAISVPLDAQTTTRRPVSSFNVFSTEQDVEIGRQGAIEADRQLPLLNDRTTDQYLTRIVQRLAAQAPGAKYPYSVKAVNSNEINAFALPGGPMYVNRGLINAARSEAELVGVLAHEMAHVALRHGTNQASKQYLGQAGLSLLGGLLGSKSTTSQIVTSLGGFGLNAAFLKFSRDDELEADAAGARMMAAARYNPVAMADFFGVLRAQQGRDPGKLENFFSSHPPPANREARIRTLAASLGTVTTQEVGGFATVKSRLGSVATAADIQYPTTSGATVGTGQTVTVNVPAPSSTFVQYSHPSGFFTITYPDNWRAYAPLGLALSMAPTGGVVETGTGQTAMLYGMIINHYAPFDGPEDRYTSSLQRSYAPFEDRTRPRSFLEDATDDLLRQILRTNTYLSVQTGTLQSERIDRAVAYSVLLSGTSPVTREEERVTVHTRALPDDHVIYALCVAPLRHYTQMNTTCTRMLRTLVIDDERAHGTGGTIPGFLREFF